MRCSNMKNKNEDITSIVPNHIPDTDIKVFYYVSDTTKTTLDFITEIQGAFKYILITTPDVDCVVFLKYGNNAEFIIVGSPPRYYLLHYNNIDNITLDYVHYNLNSEVITNGTLDSLGDDFYVTGIQNIEPSFFSVLGNISTVTNDLSNVIGSSSGEVLLDNNEWQLIAIPVKEVKVKEYLLDQIDTIIKTYDNTKSAADVVERVSAYPGGVGKFLTFIPEVTPVTTENNFQLVYTVGLIDEITAFWIKMRDYKTITNGDDIIINWSTT